MKLRLGSMTAGMAVGVTAVVVLAAAAGTFLYSQHHYETLIENARTAAVSEGRLMRVAFEHQMMENDRSLVERMVRGFGQEGRVDRLMILDRVGRVRYASAEPEDAAEMQLDSPTCQACHRLPPGERTESQVIETAQGAILRTVIPLRNQPRCHACHEPAHRINGILIVDTDAAAIRSALNEDLGWMAVGSAGLALLLVIALSVVLRLVVTRRLQRFETTARQIAAGDLERRVPVPGSDTLAWLAEEFNSMADAMTGLVDTVNDQRDQLETVLNGIEDGIVVLDVNRNVLAANDAFLRRRGRSREQLVGQTCAEETTGRCGAGDCPTQACLHLGHGQVRICERRLPDGSVAWEEVRASPIRREGQGIVQVVEVWRDISERRAAEARLAESHRLASLGLLASGFSHELNTPLATTLTCVESIQRAVGRADTLERIEENASIAREQLLRCRGITQHFLRLSRGQSAQVGLVALDRTVADVARLIAPTARGHGVSVLAEPVPADLHVRANEAELQHVLLNLLLNAIQASPGGGQVNVRVVRDAQVRIQVSDDGPGVAPENLKRIFEPFFSGRSGGTGLGLFLSRDFVRHWGGEIEVRSTPGAGATFEVVLPSEDAAPELAAS